MRCKSNKFSESLQTFFIKSYKFRFNLKARSQANRDLKLTKFFQTFVLTFINLKNVNTFFYVNTFLYLCSIKMGIVPKQLNQNLKIMQTTIKTFRGYKVVESDEALYEAKEMMRELIATNVDSTNRWVMWLDDDDNLHYLTLSDGGLNLQVSKTISMNVSLKW